MDAASMRMGSPLTDPRQQTPLLIPMQPTGAGVPLTSVVETLASRAQRPLLRIRKRLLLLTSSASGALGK